jgi:hypothetical protein
MQNKTINNPLYRGRVFFELLRYNYPGNYPLAGKKVITQQVKGKGKAGW